MDIQADHYITGDPAFAVVRDGSIVLWNDAAEQTFGYPHAEALGKKCWELMCGHDVNGNRYCFEHCPLIEMSFLHEPVHAFHTSFENASHQQKPFSVSCLTVFDDPGDEMLLHICHPEKLPLDENGSQAPPVTKPDILSQREIEILELLAGLCLFLTRFYNPTLHRNGCRSRSMPPAHKQNSHSEQWCQVFFL